MKIAVLGGSFNPVHNGHLILADSVVKELGYDKILFIPTFLPPHKIMNNCASSEDRLKMVKLALESDERFVAEDCEIQRGGVSYTFDTICSLEEKYKDQLTDKIGLIIGYDLAMDFKKWYRWQDLLEKCELILAVRNDSYEGISKSANKAVGAFDHEKVEFCEEKFQIPHKKVFNPRIDISSSDIRERIEEGRSWRYLVSEEVFNYIKNRKLYGYSADY